MTEDHAMCKWCPQAHNGSYQKCIGSQCMAWRDLKEIFMVEFNGKSEEQWGWDPRVHVKERNGDSHYNSAKVRVLKTGYCGLAGKP